MAVEIRSASAGQVPPKGEGPLVSQRASTSACRLFSSAVYGTMKRIGISMRPPLVAAPVRSVAAILNRGAS